MDGLGQRNLLGAWGKSIDPLVIGNWGKNGKMMETLRETSGKKKA